MKVIKIATAIAALTLLSACTNNQQTGITKADLDEVRAIANKALAGTRSNTSRIDRMFEKAMAK